MTGPFDDVSEMRGTAPIDQGESTIDVVLTGASALGTDSSKIKHWHVCQMPEDELAEITLTFADITDGFVDTDE